MGALGRSSARKPYVHLITWDVTRRTAKSRKMTVTAIWGMPPPLPPLCFVCHPSLSIVTGRPSYDAGTQREGWDLLGPAHIQRYQHRNAGEANADDPGSILGQLKEEVFTSPQFAQLLLCLTTLVPDGVQAEARRFRSGLDYTVAHHGLLEKDARLDVSAARCSTPCV